MKTKIAFLATLLCALAFATNAAAESAPGFYDKDHIQGFVSIGGDFRGMSSDFRNYVNSMILSGGSHVIPGDSANSVYSGAAKYSKFNRFYPGLHINVGAQYKQFLTWINFNFMPTQISERPSTTYMAADETGTKAAVFPLYDARWFSYGAEWMFGWKILGENAFFNLIPSVGIGFNIINMHFTSNYAVFDSDNPSSAKEIMRDRYYSTIAASFNSEIEARLDFNPFAVGLYAGYRVVRYNELDVEGDHLETYENDTDNVGDTWFVGLRFTWTFLSNWQKKQIEKL